MGLIDNLETVKGWTRPTPARRSTRGITRATSYEILWAQPPRYGRR